MLTAPGLSRELAGEGERMSPRGLAAKKMILPFMDKLAFIDIALAQVRVQVGVRPR